MIILLSRVAIITKINDNRFYDTSTIQFSLQFSSSILITCPSAFVHTSSVIFPKAAYVSPLTSFNRKVVLFLVTIPLTCAHINSIGLSSQCRTGVLNTSCPCKLTILSVLFFHIILFRYQ